MISLDRSDRTILIMCSCGHRQLISSKDSALAWRVANTHERRAHPERFQAHNAMTQTMRRAGARANRADP